MKLTTSLRKIVNKNLRYEILSERHNVFSEVRRIRRLSDGRLGGFIESEKNLPQDGTGWIDHNSIVRDDAVVISGIVNGDSTICGNVNITNSTVINSTIQGLSKGTSIIDSEIKNSCIKNSYIAGSLISDSDISDAEDIHKSTITKSFLYGKARISQCMINEADIKNDPVILDSEIIQKSLILGGTLYKCKVSDKAIIQSGDYSEFEFSGNVVAKVPNNFKLVGGILTNKENSVAKTLIHVTTSNNNSFVIYKHKSSYYKNSTDTYFIFVSPTMRLFEISDRYDTYGISDPKDIQLLLFTIKQIFEDQ